MEIIANGYFFSYFYGTFTMALCAQSSTLKSKQGVALSK